MDNGDLNKLIAAILTTMCRRENSIPTVEQVMLTYDRMLKAVEDHHAQMPTVKITE
ncbi:MAG TPA: hypothetical protein VGG27_15825 [Magnetospirillaceae bacterium]